MTDPKERVLQMTTSLVLRYGISAVTMDHIAKECGMSKRTLYEMFDDKTSLIKAVLDGHHSYVHEHFDQLWAHSSNTLEGMLKCMAFTRDVIMNASEAFFTDLSKFRHKFSSECDDITETMIAGLADAISSGQRDGYFLSHYDARVVATIYLGQLESLRNNSYGNYKLDSLIKYVDTSFECFMRGVVTPKGLKIFENFRFEY